MDPRTFDHLTTSIATLRSRRATLRLLAGAAGVSLLWPRPARGAQRSDRDGDGLFDDDETDVYGTNPDVSDTDGDGFGDGEEIYYGSNPLDASSSAGVVGNGNDTGAGQIGPDGSVDTSGVTGNGDDVISGGGSGAGTGPDTTIDIAPATCRGAGYPCDYDAQCCASLLCCFDGVSLRTECTDVTASGWVCPS